MTPHPPSPTEAPSGRRSMGDVDPLVFVGIAAAAIAFLLFAVWRWFDAKASPPPPAPNAATAPVAPPTVPLLSVRRAPTAAERDLSIAAFRTELQPVAASVASRGCVAVAVDGITVDSTNAGQPLIPASNQKLLTVAVALDVLGPDHTFTTEVRGTLADGVVQGDLYLIGGGDPVLQTAGYATPEYPTITPTNFDALTAQLAAAGVTSVTGNVVAIESRFDTERFPPGWSDGIRQEDAGPLGALVVNDDAFGGTKPADPAQAAADELVRQLRAAGIQVAGSARGDAAPDAPVLASVQSAPLRTIAVDVLTNSDDNAAEMLLKELGTTVALPGTRENGLAVVRNVLTSWGVDLTGMNLVDGSGLDRTNLSSCNGLLTVLGEQSGNPDFTNAPAILGQTGTLAGVLSDSPLAGVLRGKTGTLTGVKALSGYVPVEGGSMIEFSLLINSQDAKQNYLGTWRSLVDALATYPSGPTAAQLAPG